MTDTKREVGMEDFFVTEKAEDGIKVELFTPDGVKTDHWILLRGIDSPTFRTAEAASKRAMMKYLVNPDITDEQKVEKQETEERNVIAALVKDWSFDMECTPSNVVNFLTKAPQIKEMINKVSANRTLFFLKAAEDSLSGTQQKKG